MKKNPDNRIFSQGVTGFTLKCAAVITMFLDHIAWALIDPVLDAKGLIAYDFIYSPSGYAVSPVLCILSSVFHLLGRLAFPLFLFLLVEGFCYTKSIKKYIARMAAFAIISEIPYDLCMFGKITIFGSILSGRISIHDIVSSGIENIFRIDIFPILRLDNVFFTLTFALIAIWILDTLSKSNLTVSARRWLGILAVALLTFVTYAISSDYSLVGIPAACAIYLLRYRSTKAYSVGTAILCLSSISEIFAFLALPLIRCYNSRRGKDSFAIKYAFYIIYPLHLMILWAIRTL